MFDFIPTLFIMKTDVHASFKTKRYSKGGKKKHNQNVSFFFHSAKQTTAGQKFIFGKNERNTLKTVELNYAKKF